jgi:hypothetical protein
VVSFGSGQEALEALRHRKAPRQFDECRDTRNLSMPWSALIRLLRHTIFIILFSSYMYLSNKRMGALEGTDKLLN